MIGFFQNLFFTDFWLKLFSLVLAVLIWITVHLAISNEASPVSQFSPRVARTFTDLPVVLLSSAADVHTFRVTPDRVEVTVQAERQIMDKLLAKDIRVLVDVTDIEEARDVRIRVEVTAPPGVAVLGALPERVDVSIPPKRLN